MTPLDAPEAGFRDMALLDMPAPPAPDRSPGQAPVREAASRRRLQGRFLRAGREAVDDRELLELLLSGRDAGGDAAAIAASLLDIFGTAPRVLAARADRLRTVPGLSDDAIAAIKTAEALGIRMARAGRFPKRCPPDLRQLFERSSTIAEPWRATARPKQFHVLLFVDRRNRLISQTDLHQTRHRQPHPGLSPGDLRPGCLELQATALIALHNHPLG